ncbi:MAG: hypothetical protein ISS93_02630 [Candidatus Aenigmarchaeota archaeon]|nr:hypothetical protein [Candidatus Aenigmarchaeota archaeon]
MRLPYKPQSSNFTCDYATAAIAVNYFTGTDYSDFDIIRLSEGGLRLSPDMLRRGLSALNDIDSESQIYFLSLGVYHSLTEKRGRPTLQECIDSTCSVLKGYSDPDEAEKKIKKMRECAINPRNQRAFHEYMDRLEKEVLLDIGYHVGPFEKPPDTQGQIENIKKITEGKVKLIGYDVDDVTSFIFRIHDDKIVRFSATRDDFDMPFVFDNNLALSHSWIVDRVENDEVVLLDTNAHAYGHDVEVVIPKEKLTHAYGIEVFELTERV